MAKIFDVNDNTTAFDGMPGAAMRAVAAMLTAHGFEVRCPEREESRRLTITNLPGTTCEIIVDDSGSVTWEYWRSASKGADPARVTALALGLLTDRTADLRHVSVSADAARFGLQGVVGRELEAKGLTVDLEVYADHTCFEVGAEIVVTNPARPDRGQVRVGDEAGLLWETCCCGATDPDTEAIINTIIAVLAQDIGDGYIQRGEPVLAGCRRGNRR